MTITEPTTNAVAAAAVQAIADAEAVVLPEAIAANARELSDVRAALKALEEREGILKTAVRNFLEENGVDTATDGTVSVFRSKHDRKGIDRKRMEALYPGVLADVSTTTPVVQIRAEVNKIKG